MGIRTIDKQFYIKLGDRIRDIRRQRGYTLEYMAKKLGVTKQCYDHYELGILKMKPKTWDKICDILQIYPSIEINLRVGL